MVVYPAPFYAKIQIHRQEKQLKNFQDGAGKNKSSGKLRLCYKYAQDYLNNSTLHGLRYVGASNISFGERFCWLICFIIASLCAGYYVSLIYIRQDESPMIITTNPLPVTISDIPFPTITVCGMNKVKRSVANAIMENGTDIEKSILNSYCESSVAINTTQETDNQSSRSSNILKFILKAAPSCQDIIKHCEWKSAEISCEKWFNPTLTDEGLCCTFNQMPSNYIFRNPEYFNVLTHSYPSLVEDWNQENGYSKSAPADAFPWRADGAGVYFGLTLVLDAAVHDYFCATGSSAGFKLLMHNPLETPTMSGFGRMIVLNREVWFEIEVITHEATEALRALPIQKRHCYFNNEKYLLYFRQYTQANCNLECRTNYTVQICNCVPYFLPRDGSKRICSFRDVSCIIEADGMGGIVLYFARMQVAELHDEAICTCLPGCFELSFEKHGHFGLIHNSTVPQNLLRNMSLNYFTENAVIVHYYFDRPLLTKSIKRELYSSTEFLSNTGGLLGLFLGFSVLSAVELAYYLSLKLICSSVRYNKRSTVGKRYFDEVAVYPFRN